MIIQLGVTRNASRICWEFVGEYKISKDFKKLKDGAICAMKSTSKLVAE